MKYKTLDYITVSMRYLQIDNFLSICILVSICLRILKEKVYVHTYICDVYNKRWSQPYITHVIYVTRIIN